MAEGEKKRKRDMWKNIPWQRRAEIEQKIRRMPDGPRKRVLQLAFLEGMSTAEIAKSGEVVSRNHRPMSKRRALQIIAEEVPDYNAYQKKGAHEKRRDHHKFAWTHRDDKVRCAFCGETNALEWHHMIPQFLGGTAEDPNMVCLCKRCHEVVTEYQKRMFPDEFSGKGD